MVKKYFRSISYISICILLVLLVTFQVFAITQASVSSNVSLTFTPIKVGDILEYGEYPQTYVGASLNETLKTLKNNNMLTKTDDNFKPYIYNKQVTCVEYMYNGSRYLCVEEAHFWDGADDGGGYGDVSAKFSTGDSANAKDSSVQGKTYFFKVEPIKFRVMYKDVTTGEITLECIDVLGCIAFDTSGKSVWANTSLREYFNGAFLTKTGLDKYAKLTAVKNNVSGNFNDGSAADTQDYIWLPSLNDLQKWYPNNNLTIESTLPALRKHVTDFATATYTRNLGGYTYYGLRTAGTPKDGIDTVCWVSNAVQAKINDGFLTPNSDLGFAPAMTVKLY